MGYLIYHPKRSQIDVGELIVYCDGFYHNEDPYIWNDKFLHSFCHITQLKNEIGQINFWVGGNTTSLNFTELLCDCVFVIEEKRYWTNANSIERSDPIVDSDETFKHHYNWVNQGEHHFNKKKRYTLKANCEKSFQPQDSNRKLIDILPFLNQQGHTTEEIITCFAMTKNGKRAVNTRPMKISAELSEKLYDYCYSANVKLTGKQLAKKHPVN
jgi:hypothetical protein